MPTVTFVNTGKQISVAPDTTVLQAARQLGIELTAPCGGNGTCGKCRVKIDGKEVLACRTSADSNLTVELPQQAQANILTTGQTVGICGSGIIDAVATLLELNLVNKRGRIQTSEERNGQRAIDLSPNIYLTQEDIRQMQMAKGAIATGIHLMCEHLGITPAQIQKVILAGAFGSFLNPDSACRIELLPGELAGRIVAAGNLAGTGAKIVATSREQFAFTEDLCRRIEFIELADIASFQKTFAKCMMLPL